MAPHELWRSAHRVRGVALLCPLSQGILEHRSVLGRLDAGDMSQTCHKKLSVGSAALGKTWRWPP